jgi:hypothetical protein
MTRRQTVCNRFLHSASRIVKPACRLRAWRTHENNTRELSSDFMHNECTATYTCGRSSNTVTPMSMYLLRWLGS